MSAADVWLATSSGYPHGIAEDAPLVAALAARGLRAAPAVWDDPGVDWGAARMCLPRSPWDYHLRLPEFLDWVGAVARRTRLEHPPAVLRWNADKRYLADVAALGLPVIPTVRLERGRAADLRALLAAEGWADAVLKPSVGATSSGLVRVSAHGQALLDGLLVRDDVLVQPYLPAVTREGELSLVVIDGELTHAVRKRPRPGDFRVQDQFGGTAERVEPSDAEAALALRAARAVAGFLRHDLLYARVDLLTGAGGDPLVLEVEVLEPGLFLDLAPAAAERMADGILARLADP